MKGFKMRRLEKGGRAMSRIAIAVAAMLVFSAVCAWAVQPQKKSVTAGLNMGMRAVAAQDPDPKTRNPDYLAQKIVRMDIMTEKLGWSLDFKKTVAVINSHETWIFYYITARTKHIDAVLRSELKAGVKQVVIMGAGYDTRAYRFYKEFPKAKFFEVDLPIMVADKRERMRTKLAGMTANVTYAPIDFNTQQLGQVLASVGYKKNLKTLFIWEGVVMYLDAAAVEGTLGFIAENSAPGSSVVFDYLPPSVVKGTYAKDPYAKAMAEFLAMIGEPLTFGIEPSQAASYLKKQGLVQISDIGHDEMVKRYMTGSNGKTLGRMPKFFQITQAKVPSAKK